MPTDQKVIYLTFDDGPTPEITNSTLGLLKTYQAKATFFCIGSNIEKHPEILYDILKDGHAVGNHTFDHPKGWTTKATDYLAEVIKTEQAISAARKTWSEKTLNNTSLTAPNSKLFRPPYGQITPRQGRRLIDLGYSIIMWDILAFDWKQSLTPEQCANNVISKAENGSIVVFHDSVKASQRMTYALAKTLEHFSKQGYEFKTL